MKLQKLRLQRYFFYSNKQVESLIIARTLVYVKEISFFEILDYKI